MLTFLIWLFGSLVPVATPFLVNLVPFPTCAEWLMFFFFTPLSPLEARYNRALSLVEVVVPWPFYSPFLVSSWKKRSPVSPPPFFFDVFWPPKFLFPLGGHFEKSPFPSLLRTSQHRVPFPCPLLMTWRPSLPLLS